MYRERDHKWVSIHELEFRVNFRSFKWETEMCNSRWETVSEMNDERSQSIDWRCDERSIVSRFSLKQSSGRDRRLYLLVSSAAHLKQSALKI